MKSLRTILLTSFMVFAVGLSIAKTVKWDVMPRYDVLKRYTNTQYLFQNNGKWGIISDNGREILPAQYDFITSFTNGYALAGIKSNGKNLLQAIISEDGTVRKTYESVYLTKYPYFSEDYLVVTNLKGNYGYINTAGDIAIKCQFDYALPFKEGWASVKKGNYCKYINQNYGVTPRGNVLIVDFHYGEMTAASSFSNGSAVVAYNNDYARINLFGQKTRKISESEFKQTYKNNNAAPGSMVNSFAKSTTISPEISGGKYGLAEQGQTILTPQLDAVPEIFSNGTVIASLNGKFGLLRVVEGDYTIGLTPGGNTLDVDRKGNITPVQISVKSPMTENGLNVIADLGNGVKQDITDRFTRGSNTLTGSFSPLVAQDANNCSIGVTLMANGLEVAKVRKPYTIEYPVRMRVSAPQTATAQANENDIQVVYSVIHNDSNKPVDVTATLSCESSSRSLAMYIPAHGSKTIELAVTVKTTHHASARIVLSTGEAATSTVNLVTYF